MYLLIPFLKFLYWFCTYTSQLLLNIFSSHHRNPTHSHLNNIVLEKTSKTFDARSWVCSGMDQAPKERSSAAPRTDSRESGKDHMSCPDNNRITHADTPSSNKPNGVAECDVSEPEDLPFVYASHDQFVVNPEVAEALKAIFAGATVHLS